MRRIFFTVCAVTGWMHPSPVFADTTTDSDTVLDPSPFVSTRANAMGGALSTIADDTDALYYNPAGIGGLGFDNKQERIPFFRSLLFPYVGASANKNAISVQKQLSASSAQSNASAGEAVVEANSGNREFARASFSPIGLLMGRTAILPVIDHQLAAVPSATTPGDVKLKYRTFSGAIVGTSVADKQNRFSLGLSQSFGTIEETSGTFKYTDTIDVTQRNEIFKANRTTYDAKATNAGLTIRIPRAAAPSFSVVARNVGNTKNTAKTSGKEALVYDEDLTAGFSISPPIGKHGRLNLVVESGYLTQKHMSGKKKFRGGVELLLGGETSKSTLGLRAGGNEAGASFGAHLNLGLIGLEAESHYVDIGVNNERFIEQRQSAVVYVNVASF